MEQVKPWVLISEVGGDVGYPEDLVDLVKQHFRIVLHEELLQNPELHGPRIQVLFNWKFLPVVKPALLRMLPALRAVVSAGVGTDHLDLDYIHSLGVKVANTPGVVSDATADFAMGLLLASARMILQGHQVAVAPKTVLCSNSLKGVEVNGATLGIVGMGDIGYRIAQRSRGFRMKILYHNRSRRTEEDEDAVNATYCQQLDHLLQEADFVVVSVNLTPKTIGLIGQRELSLMKPTATLVNISRGQVLDQDALVEALQSGAIRGAALDVTHPEPLPRDHPLLGLTNVLITPHIGVNTHQTVRKVLTMMVENAVAATKGLTLPNQVQLH